MTDSNKGFSSEFLAQLGVQPWQENPHFVFARNIKASPKAQTDYEAPLPIENLDEAESVEVMLPDVSEMVEPSVDSFGFSADAVNAAKVPLIVIGEDLTRIWQNEASLEWQLWKNIADVFDWDVEQIPFYDTLLLVSEDAIYATLDEVMEMDVDIALSMDSDSLFAEHLQEGLQIASCPSFASMLVDPYAKKDFFNLISRLSSFS